MGLPTRNRAEHLGQAIKAILAQSYTDFELLVFDDCSSDETETVARGFDDGRVRVVRQDSHRGVPRILNDILSMASGELIVILHDHDRFEPDLLAGMVEVFDANPQIGCVNPAVAWTSHSGEGLSEMPALPETVNHGRAIVERMLLGRTYGCPITACALVPRSVYERLGFYDEDLGFFSDVDLWLRIGLEYDIGQVHRVGLVCRQREPTHDYAGPNWKEVQLLEAIFVRNFARLVLRSPPASMPSWTTLNSRRRHVFLLTVLAMAAHGDRRGVQEGLVMLVGSLRPMPRALSVVLGHAMTAEALIALARPARWLRNTFRSRSSKV